MEALVGLSIRLKSEINRTLVLNRLGAPWARMSLSTRFVIASFFVVFLTMVLTGAWVDSRMRQSVVHNAALMSTRVMESVIAPHIQELATGQTLSNTAKAAINGLIRDTNVSQRLVQVKIWRPDGSIVYTTDGSQIGERPPMTRALSGALNGRFSVDWDNLGKIESAEERRHGLPLFEVYAPMYQQGTQRIIAVAEFYEDATNLSRTLAHARLQNWGVVGLLTLTMLALLFCIVHRGNTLINEQRTALETKLEEQSALLKQNEDLRARISKAGQESAAITDKLLRRVGADLHDGPAQLLSLALLRLHEVIPPTGMPTSAAANGEVGDTVRSVMQEALAEIRSISTGVSLPQLDRMSAAETLILAVGNHERRTKTRVSTQIAALPEGISLAIKTCLYRCVQEGLNNAFRHAGAQGQRVAATADSEYVFLTITDNGTGFDPAGQHEGEEHLGLEGLKQRVDVLSGTFVIHSAPYKGTQIDVSIPYARQQ